MLRGYDLSFDEPAMNLALDEALLTTAEANAAGPSLRIWESPRFFVVLGVSQRVSREVNVETCARDGVPIARRCSAGGCVLQGPGCLNYSLVLDMSSDPDLGAIRSSYCYILTRIRDAFRARGIAAALAGTSDLAVGQLKFSGNAQRRKKRFLLHHGTILYGLDLGRIGRYLLEPEERPEYRGGRRHAEFVANTTLGRQEIVAGLCGAFDSSELRGTVGAFIQEEAERLRETKYGQEVWTHRRE